MAGKPIARGEEPLREKATISVRSSSEGLEPRERARLKDIGEVFEGARRQGTR
jgi:hypothetical protein